MTESTAATWNHESDGVRFEAGQTQSADIAVQVEATLQDLIGGASSCLDAYVLANGSTDDN